MDDPDLKKRALDLWSEATRLQLNNELPRAIELYTKSIEIFPTAEAYTFRGWAYERMGRLDEAIAECRIAIEIDPGFGNPYNDIGAYLIELGRHEEAVDWLERAKTAPRYEPRHFPYFNLARVYVKQNRLREAIAELRRALGIEPRYAIARREIERLQRYLGMLN